MANRQSLVEFVGTMAFHWSLVYPGFVAHVSPDHSGEKIYSRFSYLLLRRLVGCQEPSAQEDNTLPVAVFYLGLLLLKGSSSETAKIAVD